MTRVFAPLKENHPITTDGTRCGMCHQTFFAGQRITLVPIEISSADLTKVAMPVHATCACKGREVQGSVIQRIKDGDASPYPVLLEDGRQLRLREAGLEDSE